MAALFTLFFLLYSALFHKMPSLSTWIYVFYLVQIQLYIGCFYCGVVILFLSWLQVFVIPAMLND